MILFTIGALVAAIAFLVGVWYGVKVFAPTRSRAAATSAPAAPTSPRESDWRYFVDAYEFPDGMLAKARTRCPATTSIEDLDTGLRQFFHACGNAEDLAAAMPSQTVDEAWHEFITYTRDYADFCDRAFGRLLHHVPETTMTDSELSNNHGRGILVAWIAACTYEGLDLFGASAPVLFDADARSASLLGGFLPNGKKPVRYIGFCGKDRTKVATSTRCTARKGTVCIRHAYDTAWTQFPTEFATATIVTPDKSTKPIAMTKPAKPAKAAKSSQASTDTRRTSDTSTYDATGALLGFIAATTVADSTPAAPTSSSSHSSCGSSSHSSCGSSSSSCGSSSSSCGGGGCGGG